MQHSIFCWGKQQLSSLPRSRIFFSVILVTALLVANYSWGQATPGGDGGDAGIREATTRVTSYFGTGITLIYAIGAVAGLVGAVKV